MSFGGAGPLGSSTVEEEPHSTTIRALRELIRWYTTPSRSDTGRR